MRGEECVRCVSYAVSCLLRVCVCACWVRRTMCACACVCVVCASVVCERVPVRVYLHTYMCTYIHNINTYIYIYISKLCLVGAKTKISLNATTRRSPCGLGRGGVQKTPRPPQASAPEPPAPRPIHPGKQYQHRSRSGYLPGSGGTGAAREACTLPPRASGFVPPVYIHIYKWAGTAD